MEYEIQGYYGKKWEVETTEETRAEALKRLQEYRENVPQFKYRIRLVK